MADNMTKATGKPAKRGFLKSRWGAAVIALAAGILGLVISVNASPNGLSASMKDVADGFYNGYSGEKSIVSQLDKKYGYAMDAAYICGSYSSLEADVTELRAASGALIGLLDNNSHLYDIYYADSEMDDAFSELCDAAASAGLSEKDAAGLAQAKLNMSNADNVISQSGYNDKVRAYYRETLSRFPASILRYVCAGRLPEYYEAK